MCITGYAGSHQLSFMDVNPNYTATEVTCLEFSHQNYMASNICVLYTHALFIDFYILVFCIVCL